MSTKVVAGVETTTISTPKKVEDSYAKRKQLKPKPSPRRQQASKETKRSPAERPVRSDGNAYVVSHRERTMEQSKHGQARIKQRVPAPSKELIKKLPKKAEIAAWDTINSDYCGNG